MSNDFPDQPYLDRIRSALWRRGLHGNAAVMVGSGFSLNAKPRSASSGSFPTWAALAETVVENLYPTHGGSKHRSRALEQAKATSGFLRLAQDYEAAFGREALERLISEAVPDRQFEPGDPHELLLELPWADVFTTNWDTLLERAAERVIDRKYDVIRMVADIPASMKPRIVKLHGTLTTNRPFVFTEENFRRYPVEQAPFVNLAQQAMMENVFCLLGFSGNDPNFLYWSGWVRDHLGPYRPQIYLVGWLDLPPPRRRMLEERGVIPIDCARLPLSEPWSEDVRDRYAVEWFLWSLRAGEPYRLNNWPEPRSRRPLPIPSYLASVIAVDSNNEPREESLDRSSANVAQLGAQLETWRHNRSLYPGWLIAPRSTRERIWWRTQSWIPEILRLLPELTDGEKLECLEELNWRVEICLTPLSDGVPEAIEATLDAAGPMACHFAGPGGATSSEVDLRLRWLNLATALLRHAREEGDGPKFDRWFDILLPCCPSFPELRSRLRYERCLLALARLDHQTVQSELVDWEVSTSDTFWKIRKAGLLAESGRTEDAFRATREALIEIRRQTRKDVADIPSLSREGWAMVLAQGFEFYPHRRPETEARESAPRGIEEREQAEKRWEVLRIHKCDAWERIDECWRALQAAIPVRAESKEREVFGFDPGHRTITASIFRSDEGDGKFLPAFQVRRLVEEVGLPAVVDMSDLVKSLLLRTALWLAEPAPHESLGLILRACDSQRNKEFNEFFNRNRIALLEIGRIESLVEQVEKAVAHGVSKATAATVEQDRERVVYWMSRLSVAIELWSRLVLRLDSERAERILQKSLDYHVQPIFREHWLIKPLNRLFYRTISVLEPNRVQPYLARFIDLPMPGEDSFDPQDNRDWPDPLVMVKDMRFAAPIISPDPATVQRLIRMVALSPQPRPRAHAVRRLSILLDWGALTADQKASFGEALWRYRVPSEGFPEGVSLYNFGFLKLPESQDGLAEQVFRTMYLAPSDSLHLSVDYLKNIAGAARLKMEGCSVLQVSAAEIDQVAERILGWWRSDGLRVDSNTTRWNIPFEWEDFQDALTKTLAEGILPHLASDSPLARDFSAMVEDLRVASFPVENIYPALARLQPERLPEIADRLRQSLASSRRRMAEAAVDAIWWWLLKKQDFGLPDPPVDLVREIASAISQRRASCLKRALSAAEWIVLHALDFAGQRFVDLVAEGLGYLLEEARYEVQLSKADAGFAAEETSFVRSLCARVAVAVARVEQERRSVFQEWIRQAQEDPLPEVRLALREAVGEPDLASAAQDTVQSRNEDHSLGT